MVNYNPREWFSFIFKFHKADTFRKLLPMLIAMAMFSGLVVWSEYNWWHLTDKSLVKNISVMHSLLGFAISMLLVFRTNTAYDRWWEGRKLWGSLVNSSRNLAIKLAAFIPANQAAQRSFFRRIIPAYAYALHNHLHREKTRIELFENDDHKKLLQHIDTGKHVPNQVAALLMKHVQELYQENIINDTQLLMLNNEVSAYTDICGACERIKNTPIPFSYSSFIKKFIFFYIMTLPFGLALTLGYGTIPVVVFVFYVLASLEIIAEEIEDPFGGDPNDLPTDKIAHNIHKHIAEII
jgi:putative membrane protein